MNIRNFSYGLFDKPVLSFSKLTLADERAKDIPLNVLEQGKEIHEVIQRAISKHNNLYIEISPITFYKDVYLIGHIDMLGAEGDKANIYEIKSSRYFSNQAKLVMLQLAYYKFLLARACRVGMRDIKTTLILYDIKDKAKQIEFDNLNLKFMRISITNEHVRQIKELINLYIGGEYEKIKEILKC